MSKLNMTQKFVEKAIKMHGNKYDYSKVNFINWKTKVIIICKEHGEFEQLPYCHLKGQNCKKCIIIQQSKKRTNTTETFIKLAKKVHGNKYDYSLVNYINARTKVIIICKIHGQFKQMADSHLSRCGCKNCGNENEKSKSKKTNTEFIDQAKQIHNFKYDYSLVKYISSKNKIIIICKIHGEFQQKPNHHLSGQGCPGCARNIKRPIDDFIKDANIIHKNKYDYSLVEYKNSKVKIICPIHGQFEQRDNDHLNGHGCIDCSHEKGSKKQTKTTEQFIKDAIKIHKNTYDYSKVKYKTAHIKIKIICKKHGLFYQRAYTHLNGSGCSACTYMISNKQINWIEYLEKRDNIYIQHGRNGGEFKIPGTNLRVDGYCKEKNICYEFNGCFWHGCAKCYKYKDWNPVSKKYMYELYIKTLEKEIIINEKGFELVTIWEHDWEELCKNNK